MKKNGNPQKGIFILFLFYSVTSFLSFAISINSFSDIILKNISLFQRIKSTPFEMLHISPIGHAPGKREFLPAFFC